MRRWCRLDGDTTYAEPVLSVKKMNNSSQSVSVSEESKTGDTIWSTAYFIQAIAVFFANLLTIITFTINRHLRKRSVYCVINLAVADMLVGLGILLMNISGLAIFGAKVLLNKSFSHFQKSFGKIQLSVQTFTANATILALTLVALERMCATLWPLRHRSVGSWVFTVSISSTWSLALLFSASSAIINTKVENPGKINFYLAGVWSAIILVVICVSYFVIYVRVKTERQQMVNMVGQRLTRQERGLVTTLFIVTVASIVTWFPLSFLLLLRVANTVYVPNEAHLVCVFLVVTNSLVNPIIYVFRMRDFRRAFLKVILKCSRDRSTRIRPMQNEAVQNRSQRTTEES